MLKKCHSLKFVSFCYIDRKTPGCLKLLDNLKIADLRHELKSKRKVCPNQTFHPFSLPYSRVHGVCQHCSPSTPPKLSRLPTYLGIYEVLECKPWHDLKGHLYNLLPNLLQSKLGSECQTPLDTTLPKQKSFRSTS